MASAKVIWTEKSNLALCEARKRSLKSASCEANATFHRVEPRMFCEAKAKAPLFANSEANVASLSLPALSAEAVLSCKARTRALFSANVHCREANNEAPLCASSEATPSSLKIRALLYSAKLASTSRAKAISLLCEANSLGEAILGLSLIHI